jgi:hypothetical protein
VGNTRQLFGSGNDHAEMYKLIFGFNISQIIRAAVLFSLPEYLALGPATAESIAAAESLDVGATFRFMRACASLNLLIYDSNSKCFSDAVKTRESQAVPTLGA